MTVKLMALLELDRCPHCGVDSPTMKLMGNYETMSVDNLNKRAWASYSCKRCGGAVIASAPQLNWDVLEVFPAAVEVDESIPEKAKEYLTQAINSRSAPAGAVMLTASAVDAMLKAKQYTNGSLYSRIDKAASDHLITPSMATWAHEIRLDANDQRHVDEEGTLPTANDAEKAINFALALAEFLFVLPAKIQRGLQP